jgi:transcriptional regulator with XRE-family HTH domain
MTPEGRRQTRYAAFGPDVRERDAVLHAFGEKLRAHRGAARLTQEDLAVRCFMRCAQISRIECGDRAPNLSDLLVLARRLGVSVGELTDGLQAPVRGVGTAQVLDLISRQPGITADALAASLGLPSSYAFEIALYLQSTGAIVSQRTGWHPAAQKRRAEAVEG